MAPSTTDDLAKLIVIPYRSIPHGIRFVKRCSTCQEVQAGQLATQPFRVKQTRKLLEGTDIKLQISVGYPHGRVDTSVKVLEATLALKGGVQELDMVTNILALFSGDIDYVEKGIRVVVDTAKVGVCFDIPTASLMMPCKLNSQLLVHSVARHADNIDSISGSLGKP